MAQSARDGLEGEAGALKTLHFGVELFQTAEVWLVTLKMTARMKVRIRRETIISTSVNPVDLERIIRIRG